MVCPNCGAGREHFVADYYEAVRQGIDVVDEETGQYDYNGSDYKSYDDGSTEDECIRCSNCWDVVEQFGDFRLIDNEAFELWELGVNTDGDHHKQWCLVELGKKLGWAIPAGLDAGIAP